MPLLETARHKLPLLAVSQAHKELTHNEALVRVDALLHAVMVDEVGTPPSPNDADIGKCWLIASSATGDWLGKAGQIGLWVGGSWRFLEPDEGMRVRQMSAGVDRIWSKGSWTTAPTIGDPVNGAIIDVEARQAIITILQYFRTVGLIAG
jgi:Protein of unknown function (DUF2793)